MATKGNLYYGASVVRTGPKGELYFAKVISLRPGSKMVTIAYLGSRVFVAVPKAILRLASPLS